MLPSISTDVFTVWWYIFLDRPITGLIYLLHLLIQMVPSDAWPCANDWTILGSIDCGNPLLCHHHTGPLASQFLQAVQFFMLTIIKRQTSEIMHTEANTHLHNLARSLRGRPLFFPAASAPACRIHQLGRGKKKKKTKASHFSVNPTSSKSSLDLQVHISGL